MYTNPPKLLKWSPGLDQQYQTSKKILVTSGCSFTASTEWFQGAASWPGYVIDRCRFDHGIDLSYPGVGNEYIADSVFNYVERLDTKFYNDLLIIVMWSGLDRGEHLLQDSQHPSIDNISYTRKFIDRNDSTVIGAEIWRSYKNILFLQNYLENKKIDFGFSFYCNVFDPPFLPKRDNTPEFLGNIDSIAIDRLEQCSWIHSHKDSLFEHAFFNEFLSDDLFHPTVQGNLHWVDNILLPELEKKKLIEKQK